MDLKGVDLNLLPVLDALLRQRSATRAARELDVSQSTLSSALGRLRQQLGDELFVRTGRGLRPTARAAALAAPLADILERVRDQVLATQSFDAATAQREFRIAHTDVGAYVLWPRIVHAVRTRAPHVRLALRVMDPASLGQALADGAVDLAVGSFPRLPPTLIQRRLYDRHYVAVVSRTHTLAGRRLSLRRFADTPQLVVHGNSGVQDMITELLAAQQLQRRELLELPSYLMVPPLLALGEFLAVVPAQLADVFNAHGTLALLPLPFRLPPSTVRLYWHRRFNDDAGLRWLRELLVGELSPRSASA
ncbi:MAG: LysR family transcriptional regulator [Ottowia sp.]|nr:LysR family transcriptional regulator [Pseudomonadota bacterium]MBS0597215.1 LysR family transcriptional regulator [Pseudomonadota bacterium]